MAAPKSLGDIGVETVGEALAFAAGFAAGRALEPVGVALAQKAWNFAPIRAPEAGVLAEGVAQGQVDAELAAAWARKHGYDQQAFDALVSIANTGPAIGLAFTAWRRDELTDGQFATALRRAGLEDEWRPALEALKEERLELGAIATAVHRGIMRGEGLIVASPPQAPGKVPHVPQSDLDPRKEAAAHGFDSERLRIAIGNTGLPPGLEQMLRLLNMDEVTEADVKRAVANSNLRNEYMDVVIALRRELLTPHVYQEAALRGIISEEEADAGSALHGMEEADAKILFGTLGRPLSVRAMTTGLARGAELGGGYDDVPEPYRDAIRRSNVRPEYAQLAHANRYTLPGAFVLRSMAQAGELSQAETEELLLWAGWIPELAKKVAARWAAGGAGSSKEETKAELLDEYAGGFMNEDELRAALEELGYVAHVQDLLVHLADARRVKRWREKVVDAIGKAYVGGSIEEPLASSELAELNITGEPAALLLSLWGKQRRFAAAAV